MKTFSLPERRTLLAHKQASVRAAIGDQASRLFLEQGFQATTIEDIARAAGIGRRTFFRYFKTKEDVVLWKFDQFARCAVELIANRPARESALSALQGALSEASEFYNQEPAQTLAILKLTVATPSLYAQQLLQQDRWKCWFAEALRRRTRAAAHSLVPEVAAAIGLEAMTLAVRRWIMAPVEARGSTREQSVEAHGSTREQNKGTLSSLISSCFATVHKVVLRSAPR
jgi:AcrR family transcriptional regulator